MSSQSSNTPETDIQHYVPRFYFRQFSPHINNPKIKEKRIRSICMMLRANGKLVESTSIKGQSSKSKFYGDQEVEDEVAAFDTRHYLLQRSIIKSMSLSHLTKEQQYNLRENIIFQRNRTYAARNRTIMLVDLINSIVLSQFKENAWNLPKEAHNTAYNAIKEKMDRDGYRLWQLQEIRRTRDNVKLIEDLSTALIINRTGKPFIFSDSPVAICNPALRKHREISGNSLTAQGLLIFYPISPEALVLLYDSSTYHLKGIQSAAIQVTHRMDIENRVAGSF